MTRHKKAVVEQEVGRPASGEESRRGMGIITMIAILTILGVAIWLVVNSNGDSS